MSEQRIINAPADSLFITVGPAASGKTHFAHTHFDDTQVVSSDDCRAMVSDDPTNQDASLEAFDVMMKIIEHRLRLGKLTIADSTGLNPKIREQLRGIAEKHDRPVIALLFDVSEDRCLQNNKERDRTVPEDVVKQHVDVFRDQVEEVRGESYHRTYRLTPDQLDQIMIRFRNTKVRVSDDGPFDIIGDVHGCLTELKELLDRLGYKRDNRGFFHPAERKAVFIGDLADRGPENIGSMALVMDMVENDRAYYVPGNHCNKLYRYFLGSDVNVRPGMQKTIDEFNELSPDQQEEIRDRFLNLYESSPPYLVLDDGNLVITHAGIREEDIGKVNEDVVDFCLYGDTTGETRRNGFPVRRDWALAYRGNALIVYGHSPTARATPVNSTINIDQGAVYGGYLTALQYPERDLVRVKSKDEYSDREGETIREMQLNRADQVYRTDLLVQDFTHRPESEHEIRIPEKVMKRGLDRISRASMPMRQLVYLPSEPARGMPSSKEKSSFRECCGELVDHYESVGIEEIRIVREDDGLTPAVMLVNRTKEAARSLFSTERMFLLWNRSGQTYEIPSEHKERFRENVLEIPWLGDHEDAVIVEGLWYDHSKHRKEQSNEWLHRDRLELEEVVNRLRDARERVGAVGTVLRDLEDIHSELGRFIERVSRDQGEMMGEQSVSDSSDLVTSDPTKVKGERALREIPYFVPLRMVATDERVLLGTRGETPTGQDVWTVGDENPGTMARTISLKEFEKFQDVWNKKDGTSAWWILPKYEDGARWTPEVIPAFRLVGKQKWEVAKLISPRRWWGQEASARWAGWNSSREIYDLGRESVRRFVGSLNPSFVIQTLAGHAGLSHW